MRPFGLLAAIFTDLWIHSLGIGLAYVVGSAAAHRIEALYAFITAALPN